MATEETDMESRSPTSLPIHRPALPTENSLFSTPPAVWIENRVRIDNFCRLANGTRPHVARFNGLAMVRIALVFESWELEPDRVRTPFPDTSDRCPNRAHHSEDHLSWLGIRNGLRRGDGSVTVGGSLYSSDSSSIPSRAFKRRMALQTCRRAKRSTRWQATSTGQSPRARLQPRSFPLNHRRAWKGSCWNS